MSDQRTQSNSLDADPSRCLPLATVCDVFVGKQTSVFRSTEVCPCSLSHPPCQPAWFVGERRPRYQLCFHWLQNHHSQPAGTPHTQLRRPPTTNNQHGDSLVCV